MSSEVFSSQMHHISVIQSCKRLQTAAWTSQNPYGISLFERMNEKPESACPTALIKKTRQSNPALSCLQPFTFLFQRNKKALQQWIAIPLTCFLTCESVWQSCCKPRLSLDVTNDPYFTEVQLQLQLHVFLIYKKLYFMCFGFMTVSPVCLYIPIGCNFLCLRKQKTV